MAGWVLSTQQRRGHRGHLLFIHIKWKPSSPWHICQCCFVFVSFCSVWVLPVHLFLFSEITFLSILYNSETSTFYRSCRGVIQPFRASSCWESHSFFYTPWACMWRTLTDACICEILNYLSKKPVKLNKTGRSSRRFHIVISPLLLQQMPLTPRQMNKSHRAKP